MLIAIGVGAFFSLVFHLGVNEVKENQAYHSSSKQSVGPPAMKALDWFKERQFYQVREIRQPKCDCRRLCNTSGEVGSV